MEEIEKKNREEEKADQKRDDDDDDSDSFIQSHSAVMIKEKKINRL